MCPISETTMTAATDQRKTMNTLQSANNHQTLCPISKTSAKTVSNEQKVICCEHSAETLSNHSTFCKSVCVCVCVRVLLVLYAQDPTKLLPSCQGSCYEVGALKDSLCITSLPTPIHDGGSASSRCHEGCWPPPLWIPLWMWLGRLVRHKDFLLGPTS